MAATPTESRILQKPEPLHFRVRLNSAFSGRIQSKFVVYSEVRVVNVSLQGDFRFQKMVALTFIVLCPNSKMTVSWIWDSLFLYFYFQTGVNLIFLPLCLHRSDRVPGDDGRGLRVGGAGWSHRTTADAPHRALHQQRLCFLLILCPGIRLLPVLPSDLWRGVRRQTGHMLG